MGGVWTPPIKLVDGIWFGVGKRWIGPATRFTSGYGHVKMRLPRHRRPAHRAHRLRPRRAPRRARRPEAQGPRQAHGQAAHADALRADVDLPVGRDDAAQTDFNLPDTRRVRRAARSSSRESGTRRCRTRIAHDWGAAVGSRLTPARHRTGDGFRGPQGRGRSARRPARTRRRSPTRCDDTAYGKGKGGELTYKIKLPRSGRTTVWFGVAGSESGAVRRPRRARASC